MGFILGTVQTSWVPDFPFCGPIEMSRISYETPAVLELALQTLFFFFLIYTFTGMVCLMRENA